MRLSEWCEGAPVAESVSAPVMALVESLYADLGVGEETDCWVLWGEDPAMRYTILAPSLAGLAIVSVRPTGSADGPRGNGKLVRWSKLSVSELTIESAGGHRIVAIQIESNVLKGVDDEADRICDFVRIVLAGLENRSEPVAPVLALAAPVAIPSVASVQLVASAAVPATAVPVLSVESSRGALAEAAVAANAEAIDADDSDGSAEPEPSEAPEVPEASEVGEVEAVGETGTTSAEAPSDGIEPGEPLSREELAARRRASAAAMLAPDLEHVDAGEVVEPAPAATPTVEAEPAPAAEPEPEPAPAPVPVPVPAPVIPLPPIPGRDAWVPPHPIVEAEPLPRKPKRWNP